MRHQPPTLPARRPRAGLAATIAVVLAFSAAARLQAESGPQLVIDPTIMGLTVLQGQTAQRIVRISNPGTAPLVWTLQNLTSGWLVLPTAGGVTAPGATTALTLVFDATSRPPGELTGVLRITANAPGIPAQVLLYVVVAPFPPTGPAPGIVEGATYQLTNVGSRQALDVTGGSTGEGAAVLQWPPHSGPNQRWTITRAGAGYRLTAQHSGKVLGVIDAATGDYAAVVQQDDAGGAHQRWFLDYAPTGFHLFAAHSGRRLAVAEGAARGAPVFQRGDIGSERQQWVLAIQPDPTVVSGAIYRLVNRHAGTCLDVRGASADDGANVWSWHDNGTAAQRWRIERDGDGWRLIAQCSGKALAVPFLSDTGHDVVQHTIDGRPSQRWHLVDTGGGWYKVASAHTFELLDIAGAGSADGSDVITRPDSGQDSQRWRIEMVAPTAVAAR
jgi:hypothetical protein